MSPRTLRVLIVTPAPPGSRSGNRVTALRWARVLRGLGHETNIATAFERQRCDLMVALHARRSRDSILRFRRRRPERPLVLALTGTDLYGDIRTDAGARDSLERADRLIVLQEAGAAELPERLRSRARVIVQSLRPPRRASRPVSGAFQVCVLGHLRSVKDPLRTAAASRRLPPESRLRVVQAGGALEEREALRARREEDRNERYRWVGELPRWQALRLLGRSHLLALTSRMEGGANVVCEALALGVPVVSSEISGSIGLLGSAYPGYFPVGDTGALAALLSRAETDAAFYERLRQCCRERAALVDPVRESEAWGDLLAELSGGDGAARGEPCRP